MFHHVQQGGPTIIKRPILGYLKSCLASEISPSFVSVTVGIMFNPEGPQIIWRLSDNGVFFVSRGLN